jgi:hypothetical protein
MKLTIEQTFSAVQIDHKSAIAASNDRFAQSHAGTTVNESTCGPRAHQAARQSDLDPILISTARLRSPLLAATLASLPPLPYHTLLTMSSSHSLTDAESSPKDRSKNLAQLPLRPGDNVSSFSLPSAGPACSPLPHASTIFFLVLASLLRRPLPVDLGSNCAHISDLPLQSQRAAFGSADFARSSRSAGNIAAQRDVSYGAVKNVNIKHIHNYPVPRKHADGTLGPRQHEASPASTPPSKTKPPPARRHAESSPQTTAAPYLSSPLPARHHAEGSPKAATASANRVPQQQSSPSGQPSAPITAFEVARNALDAETARQAALKKPTSTGPRVHFADDNPFADAGVPETSPKQPTSVPQKVLAAISFTSPPLAPPPLGPAYHAPMLLQRDERNSPSSAPVVAEPRTVTLATPATEKTAVPDGLQQAVEAATGVKVRTTLGAALADLEEAVFEQEEGSKYAGKIFTIRQSIATSCADWNDALQLMAQMSSIDADLGGQCHRLSLRIHC